MLKVAVPTRNGRVDEHFGHCESFSVFTLDASRRILGVESFTPSPSCGCKSGVASRLKEMGVEVLLAGDMGQGAAMKLGEQGIAVVRGASGPVSDAVTAWAEGRVQDKGGLCAHGHAHGCRNHG